MNAQANRNCAARGSLIGVLARGQLGGAVAGVAYLFSNSKTSFSELESISKKFFPSIHITAGTDGSVGFLPGMRTRALSPVALPSLPFLGCPLNDLTSAGNFVIKGEGRLVFAAFRQVKQH